MFVDTKISEISYNNNYIYIYILILQNEEKSKSLFYNQIKRSEWIMNLVLNNIFGSEIYLLERLCI